MTESVQVSLFVEHATSLNVLNILWILGITLQFLNDHVKECAWDIGEMAEHALSHSSFKGCIQLHMCRW